MNEYEVVPVLGFLWSFIIITLSRISYSRLLILKFTAIILLVPIIYIYIYLNLFVVSYNFLPNSPTVFLEYFLAYTLHVCLLFLMAFSYCKGYILELNIFITCYLPSPYVHDSKVTVWLEGPGGIQPTKRSGRWPRTIECSSEHGRHVSHRVPIWLWLGWMSKSAQGQALFTWPFCDKARLLALQVFPVEVLWHDPLTWVILNI